jgi:hypothetical protein
MHGEADEADVKDLESALRGLRPQTNLDPVALAFRAGRASARGWAWPLAAGASATLALLFGFLLLLRPGPSVVERIVYVSVPAPKDVPPESPSAEPAGPPATEDPDVPKWLASFNPNRLSEQILRHGLDGLPPAAEPAPSAPPVSPASLWRAP